MRQDGERRITLGPSRPSSAAVRVSLRGDILELCFEGKFTRADVDAVKKISGRRWMPERLAWGLPHSAATLDALTTSFGARLVLHDLPNAAAQSVAGAASGAGRATDAQHDVPRRGLDGPSIRGDAQRTTERVRGDGASHVNRREAPTSVQHQVDSVLDRIRSVIRTREYSRKTELAYVGWVKRFLEFCARSSVSPEALAAPHAIAFLEQLAATERLSARSRNQAASAIRFCFREVLQTVELPEIARAKGPRRMPLVLTHREVLHVMRELTGKYFLAAVLLYSAGLRIEECLRLRVKDIDFELRQILVREGKGRKDRYVPLARRAAELLRVQISRIRELHTRDRTAGHGWAALPGALHRKDPNAGYELSWQWIFPASTITRDPATGRTGRWPLHVTAMQREMKRAVRRSGIPKRATCHTLRHSFATEALRGGCDIRTLQHVLGHKDIRTTMIYLHVVEQTGFFIRSPLDRPDDPDDEAADPVDWPVTGVDLHWDLAARQWSAGTRSRARKTQRKPVPDASGGSDAGAST